MAILIENPNFVQFHHPHLMYMHMANLPLSKNQFVAVIILLP